MIDAKEARKAIKEGLNGKAITYHGAIVVHLGYKKMRIRFHVDWLDGLKTVVHDIPTGKVFRLETV